MSTNYFSKALMQQVLFQINIQQLYQLQDEIQQLKIAIASRQKKHRRCDRDISKNFDCPHCQRIYASNVALKLHLKLKHKEEKSGEENSTSNNVESFQITPEGL